MDDRDLAVFRREWMRVRDGRSGIRYVNALCVADRPNDALAVCDELWDDGYVIGRTEAAWIEHGRGEYSNALALMTEALPALDGDEQLYAVGVVGCWRWHFFNDAGAEGQLRAGMRHYDSAWASLGRLLIATDRVDEGHRTFVDGVEAGNLMCMLPLANRLAERGDRDGAEQLYRRGFVGGIASRIMDILTH